MVISSLSATSSMASPGNAAWQRVPSVGEQRDAVAEQSGGAPSADLAQPAVMIQAIRSERVLVAAHRSGGRIKAAFWLLLRTFGHQSVAKASPFWDARANADGDPGMGGAEHRRGGHNRARTPTICRSRA